MEKRIFITEKGGARRKAEKIHSGMGGVGKSQGGGAAAMPPHLKKERGNSLSRKGGAPPLPKKEVTRSPTLKTSYRARKGEI